MSASFAVLFGDLVMTFVAWIVKWTGRWDGYVTILAVLSLMLVGVFLWFVAGSAGRGR